MFFKRKFYRKTINFCQILLPAAVFFLTVYLVLNLEYPLKKVSNWLFYITWLDPMTLLTHLGAAKAMPAWGWLSVLIIVLTFFFGRFFCGWICPVGGMLGILERVRRALPEKMQVAAMGFLPKIFFRALSKLRYYWLAVIIIFFAAGSGLLLLFAPMALIVHEIARLYFGQLPWLFIAAVLLGLIFFPRFWCLYVCPSGILFSLITRFAPTVLKPSGGCHSFGASNFSCGRCRKVCPVNKANKDEENQNPAGSDCLFCWQCWAACPGGAIKWDRKSKAWLSKDKKARREFVLAMAGLTALSVSPFSPKFWTRIKASPQVLRPPGAIPEEDFLASCSRCGRCVKACPSQCLVPMPLEAGLVSFETPQFVPRLGRCELCMLCPKVCAHGALKDIAEQDVRLGIAVIDKTTCLAWASNKLCLVCAEQCPVQAVIMDEAERPSIDLEKCIGCGACENSCPLDEAAVIIKPDLKKI